jgi:glycosyltransferase involved in cell wall biosynthesis
MAAEAPGASARRVLIVSLASSAGGAERSMLLLARELPAQGWSPIVACPPGDLARRARAAGARVVETRWLPVPAISTRDGGRKRYPVGRIAAALGRSVANAARVALLVRRLRADVVISNSNAAHPFVALGGLMGRRPSVWHVRDIVEEGFGRRLLGLFGRLPAAVVAISHPVAETVPHSRVRVITNPIEPSPAGATPAWRNGSPVVGFLGRLDPPKGIEDLCEAATMVDDARFVVVGAPLNAPPGYAEGLRELAERRAPGRIDFVGPVSEPGTALAAFDVLAMPSRREPWGRVAAEALIAGVPVVAAASGGLPEVVRDGVDGFLYPPGDVGALADRLRTLLGDPALRARMGAAGREGAGRFSPSAHAAAVAAVLNGAVAR